MATATDKSWRQIKRDDKEKYALYMCSREWGEKRERVRIRSNGMCERCEIFKMYACHHLTYERKYNELDEDLQAICNPCHEFTHAKSDFDPIKDREFILYLDMCVSGIGKMPVIRKDVERLSPAMKIIDQCLEMVRFLDLAIDTLIIDSDIAAREENRREAEEWRSVAWSIAKDMDLGFMTWREHGSPKMSQAFVRRFQDHPYSDIISLIR